MSIVRVGLAETKGFSEGYDTIFRSKKTSAGKSTTNKAKPAKKARGKKTSKARKK